MRTGPAAPILSLPYSVGGLLACFSFGSHMERQTPTPLLPEGLRGARPSEQPRGLALPCAVWAFPEPQHRPSREAGRLPTTASLVPGGGECAIAH